MGVFKKIATVSSLVVYIMTIGVSCYAHYQPHPQKSFGNDWYQVDDLRDHFKHTVPVKFNINAQVKASSQHFPFNEAQPWTGLHTDSIYFDSLSNRLSTEILNLLIEQKKIDLLYSFHFFL